MSIKRERTKSRRTRRGRNQKIIIKLTNREATVLGVMLALVLGTLLVSVGFFAARAMTPDALLAWEKNRLETVSGIYNDMKDPLPVGGPVAKKDEAKPK